MFIDIDSHLTFSHCAVKITHFLTFMDTSPWQPNRVRPPDLNHDAVLLGLLHQEPEPGQQRPTDGFMVETS